MSWPHGWLADSWFLPCLILAAIGAVGVVRGYARGPGRWPGKLALATLKLLGISLLLLCLVEPLRREAIPRKDANVLVLLADGSQSLQTLDRGGSQTRAQELRQLLDPTSPWQAQLEEDFDVRRFVFGERLQAVDEFSALAAEQNSTQLYHALQTIADRFAGQPSAGVLLLSDGNPTDLPADVPWQRLPPIYPVLIGGTAARDIAITQVSVSQTNFETAPVVITAEIVAEGFAGQTVTVRLQGENGQEVLRQDVNRVADGRSFAVRLEVRPEKRGVHSYEVQAFAAGWTAGQPPAGEQPEATLENNRYPVIVDRGAGPYQILYVCGRPNWDMKFLRRALDGDDEVDLSALVRVARREPKFSFRPREDGRANPLFRGFADDASEETQQYDEPVLVTLAATAEIAERLRRGFPQTAADLFPFHAVILDDVEADFFSPQVQALLEEFVSDRGGSLLMLGGAESFAAGKYNRTPLGAMLPVYLEAPGEVPSPGAYRLQLTKEGWLQEWVRIQPTEAQERARLAAMPGFQTLNRTRLIKPGATTLAEVQDQQGVLHPALVVQRYGRGRSAALLIGDLWRWQLRDAPADDLPKAWRQTARWLVADVPSQLEVSLDSSDPAQARLRVQVRDAEFQPLDNCQVRLAVRSAQLPASAPTGAAAEAPAPPAPEWQIVCEPADDEPGVYYGVFAPRAAGPYRLEAIATTADGSEIGRRETGWVQRRHTVEFRSLNANRGVLEELARRTGGRLVSAQELPDFARNIPTTTTMLTETRIEPWWHQWPLFLAALACLLTEWGVRRWRGLP